MTGEIVTAAQILVGSGVAGWAADKLLGPSFDALGEQVKIYASVRWSQIFEKIEYLAEDLKIGSLPPAFTYQALQKSSISEESEIITEMWARLLIDAGQDFSARHSLFLDIIGIMNSADARFFEAIFQNKKSPSNIEDVARLSQRILSEFSSGTCDRDGAQNIARKIMNSEIGFEAFILSVGVPYNIDGKTGEVHADQIAYERSKFASESDSLVRNGLVRPFIISHNDPYSNPHIEGVIVTELGKEFHAACGVLT